MPRITPNVSYRVHPHNRFEIHYPDITKAQKLNTITVPIKTFSFKLSRHNAWRIRQIILAETFRF